MSQVENPVGHAFEIDAEELPAPSSGISRADTLPDIVDAHAESLCKLQVSDGDFHTHAKVNDDGRVEIHINQKSQHLASHVVPTIRNHLKGTVEPPPPSVEALPESMVGKGDGSPPPVMNIVIHVVGSRGDVQPFISLGKVLREKYGHRIRLATHPTFKTFVEESGLEFFSIGGDPAELMAFMVKNPGLMPGLDSLKSGDVGQRRRGMYQIVKGCWRSCIETGDGMDYDDPNYSAAAKHLPDSLTRPFVADAIIANPPSFAHVHCAERLGIPLHLMFTMPWSPTQSFPHPLTTVHSSNAEPNMTNLVSYALVEMMTWQGLGDVMNRFRTRTLGLEPVSLMWAPGMTSRLRIPFTYCWSPALIPKPEDWGHHIFISGFYFLSLASSYTPDPKLVAFLEAGPPPVYIGFGSIVVEDPDAMTKLIFDAVKKAGVRALVSKGWGGFGGDELSIPDYIFMLGNIPHDYLFKHVSAVVHHGGAGTTAAGILAGRPTVVVPFFGDQPFWGAMTARAGAGPDPVPFKHLTSDSLAAALRKALTPEALEKAKKLGESIAQEEGAEAGAESFHRMLDISKQRCLVSPKRVAVVRIKKSTIRLSALAAIVLGDEGLLEPTDLKLYRPIEYDSEDGPWDPLTGGASALLGTLSSLMVGIADLPVAALQSLKSSVQKSAAEREAKAMTPPATPPKTSSTSDLNVDKAPIPDSTTSSRTDLSSTSALTSDSTESGSNIKIEAHEVEPSRLTPEKRVHTIQLSSVPHSKHSHHIDPGDKSSHKAAVRAERGATVAAAVTLRPVMDFTLAVSRGFHNAPKLYGDDTVRTQDKIVDFKTGIAAAGKEFGYGWYDGISGLVTQPFNGAKKHGVKGFLEGIGKGVGGFLLKPGAAIWGLGGYTFKGIYRELQKHMGSTTQSYIIASRITLGHLDWDESTPEERQMIIDNYRKIKDDPQLYKTPSHLHQSTSDLLHKMHSHHSETELGKTESHHSETELGKTESHHSTFSHHSHHSVRKALHLDHKSNHSSSELDTELIAGGESSSLDGEGHVKHKHSLRGHFHHLHKHEDKLTHTMSEVELPDEHTEIPMAKEAEIRQVMSI